MLVGGFLIYRHYNPTPTASAVVSSKNKYYSPANASSCNNLEENTIANSCLRSSVVTGYSNNQKIRYCGCALGEIEQNVDTNSLASGNYEYGYLDSQIPNAIIQYCGQYL